MAALTDDWRDKLKVHPICARLRESVGRLLNAEAAGDTKNLLTIRNGDLFVWDSYNANVLHCNLKSLLSVSQETADRSRFQVCLLGCLHYCRSVITIKVGIKDKRPLPIYRHFPKNNYT
jgi:hypothetical protein